MMFGESTEKREGVQVEDSVGLEYSPKYIFDKKWGFQLK